MNVTSAILSSPADDATLRGKQQDVTGETCPLTATGEPRRHGARAREEPRQRHRLRVRGTPDQLCRVRRQDQPRRQRADRARRQAGRAHRLSRQEQRHLFRAADGRDEGQRGDGAGELAARRPRGRLHRRGLQGAGAVRRARVHHAGPQASRTQLPSVRTIITTEGGAPEWQDFAAWRDAQSGDDPEGADQRRRTSRSSSIRRARQASRRARCCRTPTSSIWCRPATPSREAGMEQMVDRRRVAGGDADLPYRRLRLGRDGALSRRPRRDRARVRSDQGAGFLRAVRHHQAVHGAGRDAVRGAAAARADRSISRG